MGIDCEQEDSDCEDVIEDNPFLFFGTAPQVSDLIGNGVPVNLSKALGKSIKKSFCFSPIKGKMTSFARRTWEDMQLP